MRLLVSVTDAAEAIEAAAGGAQIIDVKDPEAGALGAALPSVIRQVRDATPAGLPVSAALGDGPFEPRLAAAAAARAAECGAAFVKIGLRETPVDRGLDTVRAVRAGLPRTVHLIAAGFADFRRAGSLDPLELPGLAQAAGAQGCLVDTAVKDGRGLFHWLEEAALGAFVAACRARGLLAALAGSLTLTDLPLLAGIGPDIVGVRGAACAGDRVRGRVSRERVAGLIRALASSRRGGAPPARPAPGARRG